MATYETGYPNPPLPPLELEAHPFYAELEEHWMKLSALEAEGALRFLVGAGRLDPTRALSILDWGAGFGSSTLALARYAELNGSQVETVDEDLARATFLQGADILPPEAVHYQEGLAFLADAAVAGKSYDLIWAGFYHHDLYQARQAPLFVRNCRRVMAPGGQLVVYSDRTTMRNFKFHARHAGIGFEEFFEHLGPRRPPRDLLVISAEA